LPYHGEALITFPDHLYNVEEVKDVEVRAANDQHNINNTMHWRMVTTNNVANYADTTSNILLIGDYNDVIRPCVRYKINEDLAVTAVKYYYDQTYIADPDNGFRAFVADASGNVILRLSTFVPFLITSLCIVVIVLLIHSSYGRAFKAIRDDEIAAEAMGIALFKHKTMSFVISSFFAGIGGALFAMYVANAQAKAFTSTMTYEILLIVVIGGIGSVSGSVMATFLYVACSEWWLRFLDSELYIGSFKVPLLRNGFRMVVFSVVIMIIVLFFSQGIMGSREINIGALLKKAGKTERKNNT
jgi:ABC-type uncharacterized transport system permease subunit